MTATHRVMMTDPNTSDFFYEEAIKTIRTNIQLVGIDVKVIAFTSCYPNEGKSDVVFQLSREIGKMGKKVLLLDADIRKSAFISRFGVKQQIHGLSQYLGGQVGGVDIIYQTNFENLDIIFAGPVAPNPSELLEQEAFGILLRTLRERYDFILVDTPPVGSVTDAVVTAKHCDGAVMVIENERVSVRVAAKAKEQLAMSGCRILGAVLNKVDPKTDRYYSRYGHYSYYRQ